MTDERPFDTPSHAAVGNPWCRRHLRFDSCATNSFAVWVVVEELDSDGGHVRDVDVPTGRVRTFDDEDAAVSFATALHESADTVALHHPPIETIELAVNGTTIFATTLRPTVAPPRDPRLTEPSIPAIAASNVFELLRRHGARTRHNLAGELEIGVDDVYVRAGDARATGRLLDRARTGRVSRGPLGDDRALVVDVDEAEILRRTSEARFDVSVTEERP